MDLCDNGDALSVIRIVNIVIQIIRIGVPILLILSLMINYMSAVHNNDNDALMKANKSAVSKIIAAILVFLIPTFVNLIVDIADPGNRTYFSCMNEATVENISAAYRVTTEKYIDIAKESLKESDYKIALASLDKIKNENDRAELSKELEQLYVYIEIRERIYKLAKSFDRDELKKLKTDINNIEDEEMRKKLDDLYKEVIGAKGSLSQYKTDPNDELYRNLKNFNGKTLSSVLKENGSSVEKLDAQIAAAVEEVGVGTREAPVAAALTLIETLANYGYRINYDWGGKWYRIGVDGNFGKKITPKYCDSHPNPDRCKTQLIWKGFDCSGFVNWALIQGFNDPNYKRQYTEDSGAIPLAGKTTAVCNTGDTIVNDSHITLVVGTDDERKSYLIAESSGGGVKLSYYNYNNSAYYCRKINYSN
jgi:hypothetical protein